MQADSQTSRQIIVLAGGTSAERAVSLRSGSCVASALQQTGWEVKLLDPATVPIESLTKSITSLAREKTSLVFLALHGTFGEDGTLQRILDSAGIRYTGSDAAASERAFHKLNAKRRFLSCRLPTPDYCVVPALLDPYAVLGTAGHLGYPLIVKPEAQGSSLGISVVQRPADLPAAIELARTFDECVLIERAVPGDDWTVTLLDQVALPPIRVSTDRSFFDFTAKYEDSATRYDLITDPANLLGIRVRHLALQAANALGCRGLSRVDFRVDPQGQPWLLEVNTLPGLTQQSLVPRSAAAQGWTMSMLCEQVIRSALSSSTVPSRLRA